MSQIPDGYYYTKKHEWAREDGNLLVIGITDYAQQALGDVVYVDLKPVDSELASGDDFGAIESVKAAEDLYTPVSGTVAETNAALNDTPEQVNKDAYGSWMIKLKDYDKSAVSQLMDSVAYGEYVASLG